MQSLGWGPTEAEKTQTWGCHRAQRRERISTFSTLHIVFDVCLWNYDSFVNELFKSAVVKVQESALEVQMRKMVLLA